MIKEIKLENKITEVVYTIKINCGKILGFDLASFTCEIKGKSQTIYMHKKDYVTNFLILIIKKLLY
jgi:hypothetical protein